MKSFGAAELSILACLPFAPLGAQNRDAQCNDTPPTHVLVYAPEYREWDPGRCIPVIQERPTAAVISKRALTHKPPKEARKEFDRGVQSWRKGQSNQAQHHLEEAIRLDAGFVEAQTELGALYAEAGQPALALDYFNSALALDPNSAPPNTGKASVLVMLNRPAEAEQAARRALQFDPGSIAAHYMLGTALLMQDKITPEAVTHLSVAANKYPRARAFLAEAQADPAKRRNH